MTHSTEHRAILDSDVEAAARGLQMARKSVGQLEALVAHHGKPEMLFASHVIAEAARREIERRSALRMIPHDAIDGSTDEGERFLTAKEYAAAKPILDTRGNAPSCLGKSYVERRTIMLAAVKEARQRGMSRKVRELRLCMAADRVLLVDGLIPLGRVPVDPTPAESPQETFTFIGRPTLTFRVVRRYDAAGIIPSVVGVTLDGKQQTTARIADCVFSRPEPVQDVRSMSKPELRAIVQQALDGWNGDDSSLTEEHFAAAGELERRSILGESAFEARVEASGGKSAFEYEVRDPSDGLTGHAYDLLCDQFFGLDDACGGDYDAAWERATSVLASCTPFLRAFDASQQADASVALMAASAHMEKVGADGWPNPTAALTRLAQQHCEFAVADWLAKERARRCADTKADARAIAAHWQSIADVFGRLNGKALRADPVQHLEPESAAACAPPVVERQDEPRCTIETDDRTGDLRAFVGDRCVAVAWRTLRAGHLRKAHFNVHNVWQGRCGVSAIGRTAAKTTLRRMAHEYMTATRATS